RRRVDDGLDVAVGQDLLVACGRPAPVLCREGGALVVGAGVAGRNLDRVGTQGRIVEHIGPPADAYDGDAQLCHCLSPPPSTPQGATTRVAPTAGTVVGATLVVAHWRTEVDPTVSPHPDHAAPIASTAAR